MNRALSALQWTFKECVTEAPLLRFNSMVFERLSTKAKLSDTNPSKLTFGDHLLYFNPQNNELSRDGYFNYQTPGALLQNRTHFKRRMWVLGSMKFHNELQMNSEYECQETIKFVKWIKDDCFVGINRQITRPGSIDPLIDEFRTLIYTESAPSQARPNSEWMQDPIASTVVTIRDCDVFCYSSLTFNPHRVHWDKEYCVGVEGYQTTIVQGPMIVQTLLKYAQIELGLPVTAIQYKNTHFAYTGADLELCFAAPQNGKCQAEVRNPNDPRIVYCKATISLAQ